jgi:sulfur carrier protein
MTMPTTTIHVTVNGDPRVVDAGATVSGLVAELAGSGKRIAVERNGEIVPRSRYAVTALEDGDRLEVVVAVGGG